ncbi:hypothetical protein SpCBS45565_g05224 [Spizellomyces sp. 'palustris']|nr:hypothetical protein SpCBS45565_g05224 [Spizellomyces sp. 'palustris']
MEGPAGSHDTNSNPLGLQCEYAKSSRSTCRVCDEAIPKGELRLAILVERDQAPAMLIPAWHHPACFFEHHREKATSPGEFDGIEKLRTQDRAVIAALINGEPIPDSPKEEPEEEVAAGQKSYKKGTVSGSEAPLKKGKEVMGRESETGRSLRSTRSKNKRSLEEEDPPEENGAAEKRHRKDDSIKTEAIEASHSTLSGPDGSYAAAISEANAKLRDQSNAIWAVKDNIAKHSVRKNKQLYKHILHLNGINVSDHYSESDMIAILADAMVFGVTEMCPECERSRLIPGEYHYRCPTYLEWGQCAYHTSEPKFMKFSVPGDVDVEWLHDYQYTPRDRVFLHKAVDASPLSASKLKSDIAARRAEAEAKIIETDKPFEGRTIACAGKLAHNQSHYQQLIESGGGALSKTVTSSVWFVISTRTEVDKNSNKIKQAAEAGVDVVDASYVTDCIEQKRRFNFRDAKYLLVSNSNARAPARPEERKRKGESLETEQKPKTARLTLKGGAVVNPESMLEDTHHVLHDGKLLWSVVLSRTDVERNLNMYYKLQVLEPDDGSSDYYLFRSWGRVGTSRGGTKLEDFDKQTAKEEFQRLYEEKCGNEFGKPPIKHPGMLFPLEVDFGEDDDFALMSSVTPGSKTQLAKPIQEIIKLIFDVQAMKQTLRAMEIDLSKMPLGKLSTNMIMAAYKVLADALNLVTDGVGSRTRVLTLSNQFFTLIPHDFGGNSAPLLDNEEIIRSKLEMLDAIKDIEIATSLLKDEKIEKGTEDEDPVDVHYRKLRAHMEVLERSSEEFKIVEQCAKTTHAPTHTDYSLVIEDVLKVNREGEEERFKEFEDLHNKKLLWHGSRLTNFAGILSQGLRIAPPEAPVTGYMFGKGIYFADMVSKSANYCCADLEQRTGLLLLSEVALGDMYEITKAEFIEELPKGKTSTKGCGQTGPKEFISLPGTDDVQVPMGPPTQQKLCGKSRKSDLFYNEYIVYNVEQVRIRYLVKVKFDFGRRRR